MKKSFLLLISLAFFFFLASSTTSSIPNGALTTNHDHSIFRLYTGNGRHCTGVFISPICFITVAHCVKQTPPTKVIKVTLTNVNGFSEFLLVYVKIHPHYNQATGNNDLAILYILVNWPYIKPLVVEINPIECSTPVEVYGFGRATTAAPANDRIYFRKKLNTTFTVPKLDLRQLTTTLTDCSLKSKRRKRMIDAKVNFEKFNSIKVRKKKKHKRRRKEMAITAKVSAVTCLGEAGSPLLSTNNGRLVGVVISSSAADNAKDGHCTVLRIAAYLEWIREIVPDACIRKSGFWGGIGSLILGECRYMIREKITIKNKTKNV